MSRAQGQGEVREVRQEGKSEVSRTCTAKYRAETAGQGEGRGGGKSEVFRTCTAKYRTETAGQDEPVNEGNGMDSRVDAEVLIGGKVYTLSGYESEEYFQKVASYINNKMAEYGKVDSFKKLPMDMQSVLMQINIADDYFKAKKQIDILEEGLKAKEKELYDLKHELISYQIKLENTEKNMRNLNAELQENGKKIVRLETELKGKNGKSE